MSLTLHLLRHGQTELSRADVFCGSGLDPELTPEGVQMAEAFATAYRSTSWSAIYCSSLRRTITTAQPLCDAVGIAMQSLSEFDEIGYGKWEGLTREVVERDFHDDYISWLADPAWHCPNQGELTITIARRSLKAIDEIKQQHTDGNILVVSHKATIRIILCNLLGIDVGRFRYRFACPVGSLSVIEFSSAGPMLQSLADRSHLSAALRNLPGT